MKEPTRDELSRLWTIALEAEGVGGAQSETLHNLLVERRKKTTWVGDEVQFMFSLDEYLKYCGCTI
jgi:hypothetical protein